MPRGWRPPYPGGPIPDALAACEGSPVEVTPAEMIAEDAGVTVIEQLLKAASSMGYHYMNKTQDIRRLTREGIEFADGRSLEAELKIIFSDWVAREFMHRLPISDSMGFVKTDLLMRNPDYPTVFAAGDAAAVTMPKLGAIGHQESEIVGRQIAKDLGKMTSEDADRPLQPVVCCIGDMGDGKGFYIRSNTWFGGDTAVSR